MMKRSFARWWSRFSSTLTTSRWWGVAMVMLVAVGMRVFGWGRVPPALYWDEVSLAYDAWSIAQTGRDLHAQAWPIVAFTSFGDYKPSGYFYAAALGMRIFGPHDWVVKLPSLLAGIYLVYAMGQLSRKLFPSMETGRLPLSWWAMLIAAVNPTLIHLSHVGFETNLATALLVGGIICLWPDENWDRRFRKQLVDTSLWTGMLLLVAAFYTYHSLRVVAPMMGLYLVVYRWFWLGRARRARPNQPSLTKKFWLNCVAVGLAALGSVWPLLAELTAPTVTDRFATTSIFADLSLVVQSNQCRELAGETWLSKLYCHRYLYFGREILSHFSSHFDLGYLFLSGDENVRHTIQLFGVFYPFEIIFYLLGIATLIKHFRSVKPAGWFLIFWLAIGILPASLTTTTPHLLRTLNVIPVFILLIALGIRFLLTACWSPWRVGVVGVIICIYTGVLAVASYYYQIYYPRAFAADWQDGYESALAKLADLQMTDPDLPVYITRQLGRPSIYYFWYRRIQPTQVQARTGQEKMDQGEFVTWQNVSFGTGWSDQSQLYILTPAETDFPSASQAAQITDHSGQVVLLVGRYDQDLD